MSRIEILFFGNAQISSFAKCCKGKLSGYCPKWCEFMELHLTQRKPAWNEKCDGLGRPFGLSFQLLVLSYMVLLYIMLQSTHASSVNNFQLLELTATDHSYCQYECFKEWHEVTVYKRLRGPFGYWLCVFEIVLMLCSVIRLSAW